MIRILIIISSLLLCENSVASAEQPTEPEQKLIIENEKERVYLFATPNPKEDRYTNFYVKIGNQMVETEGWEVSMREKRVPELHVVDLNHDGNKEIVVILTLGSGTWVVMK